MMDTTKEAKIEAMAEASLKLGCQTQEKVACFNR